jgi:hypothetical protein
MSKVKTSRESQSPGRRWKQWKEPEAREALASWRRSGLSAGAFCAREGYSQTRLRYWSERLSEQSARSSSVSFVPVALGDIRRAHLAHQIEIEHAGVVLRVREDLDVAQSARLVAALGAGEPSC